MNTATTALRAPLAQPVAPNVFILSTGNPTRGKATQSLASRYAAFAGATAQTAHLTGRQTRKPAAQRLAAPATPSSDAPQSTDRPGGTGGSDNTGPIGKPYGYVQKMRRGGVAVYTSQGWVQLGLPMGSHLDAIQMFFKNGGQPGKTPSDKLGHYMPLHYVPVKGYTTFTTGYHAVDFTRYPYFWPLLQQAGFNFYLPTPGDAGKVSAFLKEAFQGRNPQKLTDSVRDEHASNEEGIPDLGTETQRFANKASEDFSRVTHFENDEITIGDGSVVVKQAQEKGPMAYEIYDRGHLLRTIDLGKPEFAPPVENLDVDPRTMFDPKFQEIRKRVLIDGEAGLWPISTADYFSGEGTSGFMLWKDGKVTLIDPPAQTVAYLIQNGIPLNAVEGIAITHDHTDHFTPASIELMFLCPKLNWYGTKTLYNICQDAYTLSIAVNGKPEGLTQLNFVELKPRQFVAVRGMWLRTHYTCHSVAAEAIE
ncbi:MAG TPA: hypothetical protein VJC18_02080, partial [bacterium]|nr:hypothetical protein [bacterium]